MFKWFKRKQVETKSNFDEELEWGKIKDLIRQAFDGLPEPHEDEYINGDEKIDYGE